MAMNGNDILVYVILDGYPFAMGKTKSHEIESECETIEVSSPSSGQWKQRIAGRKSWTLQISWLMFENFQIQNLLEVGNKYNILFKERGPYGGDGVQGDVICTSCEIKATKGNIALGNFQFVGSGELSQNHYVEPTTQQTEE